MEERRELEDCAKKGERTESSEDFLPFESLFPQSELDAVEDYFFQQVPPLTSQEMHLVPEACKQLPRRPIPEPCPRLRTLDTINIGQFSIPTLTSSHHPSSQSIILREEGNTTMNCRLVEEKEHGGKRRRKRREDELWEEEDEEEEENLASSKTKCELKSKVARRRKRTDKGTFIKQQPFKTQEELDMESSDEEN